MLMAEVTFNKPVFMAWTQEIQMFFQFFKLNQKLNIFTILGIYFEDFLCCKTECYIIYSAEL